MNEYEQKIVPELRRWIQADTGDKKTVIVRIAHSMEPDDAASAIESLGMASQTCGPSVIVASTDCDSLKQVAAIPWVHGIETPQRLGHKTTL